MLSIGIDIGGTKIAAGLVTDEGEIVRSSTVPTPAQDTGAIVDAIVALVNELSVDESIAGVGIAAAGFIDASQSVVYYGPNIAWRDEPLRAHVEERLDFQVVIDNDANAAGWAEYTFGAGRLFTHMTMLTVGTGVGGAIVADGQLFRGGFGVGAELGHLIVEPGGLLCGCGQRGCIEQYGSGRALLRFANDIAAQPGLGSALAAARDASGSVPADALKDLLVAHDPGALAALAELGGWLGKAAASLAAVLDPQVFVIGGGVAVAGELLLDPIRESYRNHLSAAGYHPEAEFRTAQMLNDAGVVGAADLARLRFDATRARAH